MQSLSTFFSLSFRLLTLLLLVGYAFVYFEDERDAEDAIHALDNTPFGYDRRKLSVEWARVCLALYGYNFLT